MARSAEIRWSDRLRRSPAVDQYTCPRSKNTAALNKATQTSASLRVDDLKVLLRSTEAESNAAHGMDEGVGAAAVYLASQAPDIAIDDVRHRVEMHVPHMLQQHRARDYRSRVADDILDSL